MKYTILLMIALLVFTFTACTDNSVMPIENETSVTAEEATSVFAEDEKAELNTDESEPTDSVGSSDPTESPEQTTTSKSPDSTVGGVNGQADTANKASNSTVSQKPETTAPSASSKPPATTTPPPTTMQPPVTSEPTPAFDINYWIDFAKDYGESIGLIYDEGTTGSWDTPLAAGPTLKYTERDIKDRLNRYKNIEGVVYFSVWAEARQDGSGKYDIYIGYA